MFIESNYNDISISNSSSTGSSNSIFIYYYYNNNFNTYNKHYWFLKSV